MGELGIAHLEQPARLGEFGFELLHARLNVRAARRRGRSRPGVAGIAVAVDGVALPCSGVTSRNPCPASAAGPAAAADPSRHIWYWRQTSAVAADAEIAATSLLLGIASSLPARKTLILPPKACGFAW